MRFPAPALAFGSVLERLFARLVSINSFTEFTLKSQQRGGDWLLGTAHGEKGTTMSEVASAPPRVHRRTPLPDAFWRGVRETPWRYDLFQLLRRIDAQGGERYPPGARRCRNLSRYVSVSSHR